MEEKKVVTLDLTGCKYLGEVHQRIKQAFGFPDFYGQNWSAFDDLLWSECDADVIIVLGENTLPQELGPSAQMINEILQEFKEYCAKDGEYVELEIRS